MSSVGLRAPFAHAMAMVAVACLALSAAVVVVHEQAAAVSPSDDGVVSVDGIPTEAAMPCWAVPVGLVPLQIRRDRVLDNPSRRRIHSLVRDQPGIHLRGLVRASGLAFGAVSYHIRVLEDMGYVQSWTAGTRRCFYPCGTLPRPDTPSLTSRQIQVLEIVEAAPGTRLDDVAHALGLSPKTVAYHARGLRARGWLITEWAGRTQHLRTAADAGMAQA